jgi:hypothetical protein
MSAPPFSIKSNTSDRELVFRSPRRDNFVVELRGVSVGATCEVYAYRDARGLSKLFSRLAVSARALGAVPRPGSP